MLHTRCTINKQRTIKVHKRGLKLKLSAIQSIFTQLEMTTSITCFFPDMACGLDQPIRGLCLLHACNRDMCQAGQIASHSRLSLINLIVIVIVVIVIVIVIFIFIVIVVVIVTVVVIVIVVVIVLVIVVLVIVVLVIVIVIAIFIFIVVVVTVIVIVIVIVVVVVVVVVVVDDDFGVGYRILLPLVAPLLNLQ